MKLKVTGYHPVAVIKRAFYLAWQACGGPVDMGVLQDRPSATEEEVWGNVCRRGDYPGLDKIHGAMEGVKGDSNKGEAYGDYVFGRMMKLGIKWEGGEVVVQDGAPRSDYQAWCVKYPTYRELILAADGSLGGVRTV